MRYQNDLQKQTNKTMYCSEVRLGTSQSTVRVISSKKIAKKSRGHFAAIESF